MNNSVWEKLSLKIPKDYAFWLTFHTCSITGVHHGTIGLRLRFGYRKAVGDVSLHGLHFTNHYNSHFNNNNSNTIQALFSNHPRYRALTFLGEWLCESKVSNRDSPLIPMRH